MTAPSPGRRSTAYGSWRRPGGWRIIEATPLIPGAPEWSVEVSGVEVGRGLDPSGTVLIVVLADRGEGTVYAATDGHILGQAALGDSWGSATSQPYTSVVWIEVTELRTSRLISVIDDVSPQHCMTRDDYLARNIDGSTETVWRLPSLQPVKGKRVRR
jgi:hypothetical protein